MLDWFFVVNPRAKGGRGIEEWNAIEKILTMENIAYSKGFTACQGHAAELAQKAVEAGKLNLVAVGGDGTVNEVVNGIFRAKKVDTTKVKFAAIPIGTGNDWSKMHQIPNDYRKCIDLLKNPKFFLHDIGIVRYQFDGKEQMRHFINVAGMALDAYVARHLGGHSTSKWSGNLRYLIGLARSIFTFQAQELELHDSTKKLYQGKSLCVNIGICKYSGNGMCLVPKAVPDDGLLDVTIIEEMSPFEVIKNVMLLYNEQIYTHPKVHHFRVTSLHVSAPKPVELEVDGELIGTTPIQFSVLPKVLQIVELDRKTLD